VDSCQIYAVCHEPASEEFAKMANGNYLMLGLLPLHRPETASAAQPHDRSIVSCAAGVPVQTHGSGVVCELAITITDHGSGEVADELRW
jgi:hypothetical protein